MILKVYRLEEEYKGDSFTLSPRIPTNIQHGEDQTIKRICVCPTIIGCIKATQMCFPLEFKAGFIPIHLYSATIDTDICNVYQPLKEVPDAFMTGELWLLNETKFTLERIYDIKHIQADHRANAFMFTSRDYKEENKNGFLNNEEERFLYIE